MRKLQEHSIGTRAVLKTRFRALLPGLLSCQPSATLELAFMSEKQLFIKMLLEVSG
jgi:hypothetical protein